VSPSNSWIFMFFISEFRVIYNIQYGFYRGVTQCFFAVLRRVFFIPLYNSVEYFVLLCGYFLPQCCTVFFRSVTQSLNLHCVTALVPILRDVYLSRKLSGLWLIYRSVSECGANHLQLLRNSSLFIISSAFSVNQHFIALFNSTPIGN